MASGVTEGPLSSLEFISGHPAPSLANTRHHEPRHHACYVSDSDSLGGMAPQSECNFLMFVYLV